MAGTSGVTQIRAVHLHCSALTKYIQISIQQLDVRGKKKKKNNFCNQTIHLKKFPPANASPLLLLIPHYLPLCLPGSFRKKAKRAQQTLILHLLPDCSAPISRSPKGCMGRQESQTRRSPGRKPIQSQHKILHSLASSVRPQQTSSRQQ